MTSSLWWTQISLKPAFSFFKKVPLGISSQKVRSIWCPPPVPSIYWKKCFVLSFSSTRGMPCALTSPTESKDQEEDLKINIGRFQRIPPESGLKCSCIDSNPSANKLLSSIYKGKNCLKRRYWRPRERKMHEESNTQVYEQWYNFLLCGTWLHPQGRNSKSPIETLLTLTDKRNSCSQGSEGSV